MEKLDLNYKIVEKEFHSILVKVGNKLEREWPNKYMMVDSGQVTMLALYRVAVNFYKTIVHLCSDKLYAETRDSWLWLSVPPLNRTILEILVSSLYILENFPEHTKLFHKVLWFERSQTIEYWTREYGGSKKWDDFIEQWRKTVDRIEKRMCLTTEEKTNPSEKIGYWPKVNKVIKRLKKTNSPIVPFIIYLNDWFYRELSAQSHLEPSGLLEIGVHFLSKGDIKDLFGDDAEEKLSDKLKEFKTRQVWIAITLMMSLASEIEIHFRFGLEQELAYLWTMFNTHSDYSEEIYSKRYEELLVPKNP